MCHAITWYYGRCQHPDPEATSIIACKKALLEGYDCIDEYQEEIPFALKGYCLKCKLDALTLRQSIIRNWKRQRYWAAMNGTYRYHRGDCTADESDDEEYAAETPAVQSPDLSRRSPTGSSRDSVSFYNDPACKPTLVQPAMPYSSCSALVEYSDDEEDSDVESLPSLVQDPPGKKSQTWRSWLPLPSRLLRGRQSPSFSELISDDDMSDAEPLLGTSGPRENTSRLPLPSRLMRGRQSPSFSELISDDEMSDAEPLLGTSRSRKCSGRRSRIPRPIGRVPRT
ncbi:uncharacterized protein N7515_002778 [Penicillium bovifimosum]|uniref:Uncharacterized protein n=1 Tax=Penicillium bovifimosum TaxID=126998 RepID=A0A9W9HE24_9EURO|nr:uncharacterized protein N7515_002778 [Penicillium bovifimosum]KAJ5143991.1 hypothetical protein N7515_002778 [Penicillium bovifimosum]